MVATADAKSSKGQVEASWIGDALALFSACVQLSGRVRKWVWSGCFVFMIMFLYEFSFRLLTY